MEWCIVTARQARNRFANPRRSIEDLCTGENERVKEGEALGCSTAERVMNTSKKGTPKTDGVLKKKRPCVDRQ